MQTKFKRHQKVKVLVAPDPQYVEYHTENPSNEESEETKPIVKGMSGIINILLSNGKYHVEILDENSKTLAYAPFAEEDLEAA
jgi:hypothetical protein